MPLSRLKRDRRRSGVRPAPPYVSTSADARVSNLVANPPDLFKGLPFRILERPVIALQARHERALVTAAHRHQKESIASRARSVSFCGSPGSQVDTELAHDLDDLGMYALARSAFPPKRRAAFAGSARSVKNAAAI